MPKYRRNTQNKNNQTSEQLTPTKGPRKGWKGRTKQMAAGNPSTIPSSISFRLGNVVCEVALSQAGQR